MSEGAYFVAADENDSLRRMAEHCQNTMAKAERERDEARAEVEQWKAESLSTHKKWMRELDAEARVVRERDEAVAELDVTRHRLIKSMEERDQAVALLKELEWGGEYCTSESTDWEQDCPVCDQRKRDGHAPDCRLDAFLAGGGQS